MNTIQHKGQTYVNLNLIQALFPHGRDELNRMNAARGRGKYPWKPRRRLMGEAEECAEKFHQKPKKFNYA